MATVYEKLRDRLDMFPQGFPRTGSGVELQILERLFSPDEAEIMFFLRPYPEGVPAIAGRAGKDESELGKALYDMSKKGLILRFRAANEELYYFLAPWVVGIFEFQLNNLSADNIHLFEKYYEEGMVPAWRKGQTLGFRVIPIEKQVEGSTTVQPFEKVSEIINSHTVFAVADCICRKEQGVLGKSCGKLQEACMVFGAAASYYIENGIGREISREEAKGILAKAEEEGLVHCSTNHSGVKMFICNCCGCCCGLLKNITRYDNPAAVIRSNYCAASDESSCTACGTCVERCQVTAIRIQDQVAIVDKDRCIGCGLCVSTCPSGAMSLAARPAEEALPVFASEGAMLKAIGKDKGKKFPFD